MVGMENVLKMEDKSGMWVERGNGHDGQNTLFIPPSPSIPLSLTNNK